MHNYESLPGRTPFVCFNNDSKVTAKISGNTNDAKEDYNRLVILTIDRTGDREVFEKWIEKGTTFEITLNLPEDSPFAIIPLFSDVECHLNFSEEVLCASLGEYIYRQNHSITVANQQSQAEISWDAPSPYRYYLTTGDEEIDRSGNQYGNLTIYNPEGEIWQWFEFEPGGSYYGWENRSYSQEGYRAVIQLDMPSVGTTNWDFPFIAGILREKSLIRHGFDLTYQ